MNVGNGLLLLIGFALVANIGAHLTKRREPKQYRSDGNEVE